MTSRGIDQPAKGRVDSSAPRSWFRPAHSRDHSPPGESPPGPFNLAAGAPPRGAGYAYMVGPVVDFGPEGSSFSEPVTVTVPYSEKFLPAGVSEDSIAPAYWNSQTWVALSGAVDKSTDLGQRQAEGLQGVAIAWVAALGTGHRRAGVVLYHKLTASDAVVDNKPGKWITPNAPQGRGCRQEHHLGGVKLSDHRALRPTSRADRTTM